MKLVIACFGSAILPVVVGYMVSTQDVIGTPLQFPGGPAVRGGLIGARCRFEFPPRHIVYKYACVSAMKKLSPTPRLENRKQDWPHNKQAYSAEIQVDMSWRSRKPFTLLAFSSEIIYFSVQVRNIGVKYD